MRLKSVVKYNLSEMKNSILIFYGVILLIMILFAISVVSVSINGSHSSLNGVEMASTVFLFVVGITFFKQNYLFLSTNGVTRKAQFNGFLVSSVVVAVIMAAVDTIYVNILPELVNYNPLFRQAYSGFTATASNFVVILTGFAWSTFIYLLMLVLGYFIRVLFYRMSRTLKIVVSMGIPAFYTIILPLLDFNFTKGMIGKWVTEFFKTIAGLNGGYNPYIGIMFAIMGTVILACLSYLLVRRAPLKE